MTKALDRIGEENRIERLTTLALPELLIRESGR
jgi:hypothetical protein